MPNAVYVPEALLDIDQIYREYEARALGLGERFLTALGESVGRVESNPWLYGEVALHVRAVPLRRFPQVIYYRPESERVVILAVRHGRDNPQIWESRV